MKPHTRIYLSGMGYDETDFIPCEVCESKAVDIHHINARGMGGSKTADTLENLMALCRHCHDAYGDITKFKDDLKTIHNHHMKDRS
jgi:5-methylcytosine-specific restriction endonuclease McrA